MLANSVDGSDCTKVANDDNDKYQSCGHVIMEFWNGNSADMEGYFDAGVIENLGLLGAIGQQALFVTKFTAKRHFHTPTQSPWDPGRSQSTKASRNLPAAYHMERLLRTSVNNQLYDGGWCRTTASCNALYTGHFRYTDQNNCTANPTTCTGHIADFPWYVLCTFVYYCLACDGLYFGGVRELLLLVLLFWCQSF